MKDLLGLQFSIDLAKRSQEPVLKTVDPALLETGLSEKLA
jgi:hypothetical protein